MDFTMGSELDFPARININLSINGSLLAAANWANAEIHSKWGSELVFQANGGRAIPHVTMLMGVVPTPRAYAEIVHVLNHDESVTSPNEYRVGAPYLPSRQSGFVFADVEPQGLLREQRLEVANLLSDMINFDVHGGPENISHLTLGYAVVRPDDLTILDRLLLNTSSIDSLWRTALVGNRGAALEILDEFPLRRG